MHSTSGLVFVLCLGCFDYEQTFFLMMYMDRGQARITLFHSTGFGLCTVFDIFNKKCY